MTVLGTRRATRAPVAGLARAWRGLVWYLRTASGETRWDAHVARCTRAGLDPGTRRAFERRRQDVAEATPQARCC
ncbi:YbdD/YjiX family protein [Jannaschia sp. R86511]|uniref:YbdD/YjiX family protein n=1 Tax=Jannaschia sp. R86511 TaxID=3093853 RepID=UPI0036D322B0